MLEGVVIAIFAIWLILSLLVYIPPLTPWVRRWDIFAFIPEWKFFAPLPPQHDYHLLYRDVTENGSVSGFCEIFVAENRRWWNFVWNPGRRTRKAFFDIVTETARESHKTVDGIEASVPYLTILNFISEKPRGLPAKYTQFIIIQSQECLSKSEPQMLLLSNIHSL